MFPNEPRLWETEGVTVGLGVELNIVPTLGFMNPVVSVPVFDFCVSGTKTDERGVDIYLME